MIAIDGCPVERGTLRDYAALARFHYKPGHPGVVTRVYRIVERDPALIGPARARRNEAMVVAVLVVALPHPGCVMRDEATGGRYRGLDLTSGTIMLNREVRTISRVIVHPQFRGLGLAVRLVRHTLDHAETVFTEALAAMGRVHPFFDRAGMTRYERPVRPEHARLLDALESVGLDPVMLAMPDTIVRHIDGLDDAMRRWLTRELRIWNRKACMQRNHRQRTPDLSGLLAAARERLLQRPIYYLRRRDVPEREAVNENPA